MADAGSFGEWIVAMRDGMRDGTGSDVPCDGCVACCTSDQTIVVDADEHDALTHLPVHALVPLGDGDHVLARDEDGRCVLLVEGACTVYEHRPLRCRTYDCRIFPATGLQPEADKPAIAERSSSWRFRSETPDDHRRQAALRMAVAVLRSSQMGGRPPSATQLAAAAVMAHEEFLPD